MTKKAPEITADTLDDDAMELARKACAWNPFKEAYETFSASYDRIKKARDAHNARVKKSRGLAGL